MHTKKGLLFDATRVGAAILLLVAMIAAAVAAMPGIKTACADEVTGQIELSQKKINKVGKQTRGGQCLCYSYAYAQTVTTNKVHSWSEYSLGGAAYARWFPDLFSYKTCSTKEKTLKTVYKAVTKGKPVVLHLRMKNGGQHWVCVVGYEGADPKHLKLSDFLALDSVDMYPDEPCRIDTTTYSLYLDSNNVRVSKSSANFDLVVPDYEGRPVGTLVTA